MVLSAQIHLFFFFNDTATTEIYTLSLHDALPICQRQLPVGAGQALAQGIVQALLPAAAAQRRSEEHTSELQSHSDLVCRLLLEKKKITVHAARQSLRSWTCTAQYAIHHLVHPSPR